MIGMAFGCGEPLADVGGVAVDVRDRADRDQRRRGTITPASAGCMCSSSSCRFRKYHGALDGFGVRSGLACASSGAFTSQDKTISKSSMTRAAMNSMISRCGQTNTVSSRSTRGGTPRLAAGRRAATR